MGPFCCFMYTQANANMHVFSMFSLFKTQKIVSLANYPHCAAPSCLCLSLGLEELFKAVSKCVLIPSLPSSILLYGFATSYLTVFLIDGLLGSF